MDGGARFETAQMAADVPPFFTLAEPDRDARL